jgi:IS30 family transposase
VHQSSISREISRNSGEGRYVFKTAEKQAVRRRRSASRIPKKMKGALESLVLQCLEQDWSPEQISGRLKLEGICISHGAIYNTKSIID